MTKKKAKEGLEKEIPIYDKMLNGRDIERKYPSVILGLDISTSCIGISIVYDDGENVEVREIRHISPKIDKNVKGMRALIERRNIFEEEFLTKIGDRGITECVIEAPLFFAMGNSSVTTVSQLLMFNALLSDSIYRKLGIIPYYISSQDARTYSFPELLAIRRFNKKGETYPLSAVKKYLKDGHLIPFGSYPFDCDKKYVMMSLVQDKFKDINWLYNAKGELKKENFDACDSLVCALAYVNKKRYGELECGIEEYTIGVDEVSGSPKIEYTVSGWGGKFREKKTMICGK